MALDRVMALHLANRLGFGPAPGQLDHIIHLGFDGYVEEQLSARLQAPEALQQLLGSLPVIRKNTYELFRDHWWKAQAQMSMGSGKIPREEKRLFKVVTNEVGPQVRIARMARAIASPNQLHESLVDFWFNNFNVYARTPLVKAWGVP